MIVNCMQESDASIKKKLKTLIIPLKFQCKRRFKTIFPFIYPFFFIMRWVSSRKALSTFSPVLAEVSV